MEYKYVQKPRLEDELDGEDKAGVEYEAGKILDSFTFGGSIWTRPAIYENLVIFGSNDGNVYALDRFSGSLVWKFLTGGVVIASPIISGGVVYIGSMDKKFYAIDAKTGEKKWDFLTGGRIASTAAVVDGKIYFGSEDGKLYCLSKTGEKAWDFLTGGIIIATPAVVNGKVYFGSCDSRIYCVEEGRKIWSFLTGSSVGACTIIDQKSGETVSGFRAGQKESSRYEGKEEDLRICFGSFDGYFYCLNSEGKQVWKFQADAIVGIMRGYTVAEGLIYFGAQKLFAADIRDGSKVWEFRSDDRFGDTGPLYVNGVLLVGAYDGNLYALDAKSGKKVFVFRTGGPLISPPASDSGIVYFGSTDTYLYALDISQGKAIWTFKTGAAPSPVAWRGIIKKMNPFQRLKRWWKPELPKSVYSKEEKKVEWAKGYGLDKSPYKMERKDVAYFGLKDYDKKINLDEEAKKKRENRW